MPTEIHNTLTGLISKRAWMRFYLSLYLSSGNKIKIRCALHEIELINKEIEKLEIIA
jgi:hypothetical protein